MNDNIKVDESFVNALVKNAAWDAARVNLAEAGDPKAFGGKKGDKSQTKKGRDFEGNGNGNGNGDDDDDENGDDENGDPRAFGGKKGDKSKTHKGRDFEGKESVDAHVCPLCESILDEALSDETIREHVLQIQNALLSEADGEDDDMDEEEEEEPVMASKKPPSKKEAVMKKVKELKKSAKG